MGSREGAEGSAATKTGHTVEEWRAFREAGFCWCITCREWIPGDRFVTDRSRSTGKASSCRPCASFRSTACRYGLTMSELQALFDKQSSTCLICERSGKKLEVDHDHETGAVRGLLCSRCNKGLGQFCDDPSMLKRALAYLEDR